MMNKKTKTMLLGIALMAVSFYSIGPVICDEFFQNACYAFHHTEHFYTVLPFFLGMFVAGLVVLLVAQRSKNL